MKRLLVAGLSLGLAAALSFPAGAQEPEPVTIPETVSIEDPLDDANGINDQGNRADFGFQGDHATPIDAGSVSDVLKVWFSHDAESVSVHFQTQAPAPASTATLFEVFSNVGGDFPVYGCLRFAVLTPGSYQGATTTYQGEPIAKLIDRCNDGSNFWDNGVEGEITITEGPEVPQQNTGAPGPSGILTATFPRSYSPLLADGLSLVKPFFETTVSAGTVGALVAPVQLDNSIEGADYMLTASELEEPKPPVKKGCTKGSSKAKKKGCHKPNPGRGHDH